MYSDAVSKYQYYSLKQNVLVISKAFVKSYWTLMGFVLSGYKSFYNIVL